MIRSTVIAVPSVEGDLARIWIGASDRQAIAQASDAIDRLLREDAHQKGDEAGQGLRQLIVPPLIAKFTVNEDDRIVTIWTIRHVGTLTNGY